jgi:hypothetical protein
VYSNFPKGPSHTPSSSSCRCTHAIASLSNPLCNSHTPMAPRTLTSSTADFNSARGDKGTINPPPTLRTTSSHGNNIGRLTDASNTKHASRLDSGRRRCRRRRRRRRRTTKDCRTPPLLPHKPGVDSVKGGQRWRQSKACDGNGGRQQRQRAVTMGTVVGGGRG